jgi:RTX calcium-binding nonapeptide repeat (4 copies)
VVRQAHLIEVVGVLLIGCAALFVGCAGGRSEAPEEQRHTEATKEQARSPEATESEQARCEGTQTFNRAEPFNRAEGAFTTNDLPGCPKGGLLSGTDKRDYLAGKEGDDEIRGLGARDIISGGVGNDVIYGGDGNDLLITENDGKRDEIYCGKGTDIYFVSVVSEGEDKIDLIDNSCEVRESVGAAY